MCLFPNKIFGFVGLFAWEEHKVHVLKRRNECSYEKKKRINLIRLMFFFLNFLTWFFFYINLNTNMAFKNAKYFFR